MSTAWINEWALVRQSEMSNIDAQSCSSVFEQIWHMIYNMYGDMAIEPERFGLPIYAVDKFHYGTLEARISRHAPWTPIKVLLFLFASGTVNGNVFTVNTNQFKECFNLKGVHKIRNINNKIEVLTDYGFVIHGLKNYKITSTVKSFDIEFPDNPEVLTVLHQMAVTTMKREWDDFSNPFLSWNPRILREDDIDVFHTMIDKIKNADDREFIETFHQYLIDNSYIFTSGNWNEGPGIHYYKNSLKEPYIFRMLKNKFEFQLFMRIRNANNCLEYVADCPESVKDIFRSTSNGCANRNNGCRSGVSYVFEGEEKWKCGCCNAPFIFHPDINDIPHYMKLIELGLKR